jgi:lipoyl(octanoyl) transferase
MQHASGYSTLNGPAEAGVHLRQTPGLTAYPDALAQMEADVAALQAGMGPERLWLLEHPPLYTAGISAKPEDLIEPNRFPVFHTGRGGQFTYHGPGQRIGYVMLDLKRRDRDVRAHVGRLEAWLITALDCLGVRAGLRPGCVGVWVDLPDGRAAKIAAIGVKVQRWATFHGVALNVAPDLSHFAGIVPCGIRHHGVTSLAALGVQASMATVDDALLAAFAPLFGPLKS